MSDIPTSGELLNDEFALVRHPLAPFDPKKTYRVRFEGLGCWVVGEWEATADPPKRPEEMTELGLAIADALHLEQIVVWIDKQLRRWPWLYQHLQ